MKTNMYALFVLGVALASCVLLVPEIGPTVNAQAEILPIGGDHPRISSAASSCVPGCGAAPALWDSPNAIDDSQISVWSSVLHWTPSAYEWYAFWFDSFRPTDYVRYVPRMVPGAGNVQAAGYIPERIFLYYSGQNGQWNFIRSVPLPAGSNSKGIVINFPEVVANGILVTTDRLRADNQGAYYFQIAEIYAGTSSCSGFVAMELEWCRNVPRYFQERSLDTDYIQNTNVRIGANGSFGGTIFELYSADRGRNLIFQHGGAAMQLSLYGYLPSGPTSPRAALCKDLTGSGAAHNPYNPIMAVAAGCTWDDATRNAASNDLDARSRTPVSIYGKKTAPWQYTWNTNMPGLTWEQNISLGASYAKLDYRITYSGTLNLTEHPQELPALFTTSGMGFTYYYYSGGRPYWNDPAVTRRVNMPTQEVVRLPNRNVYHRPGGLLLTEGWVSNCDVTETRCITVATYSEDVEEFGVHLYPDQFNQTGGGGYVGPVGWFSIAPGLDKRFTIYVFPYKYDRVVSGKSVRQWIYDLKP